MENIVWGAEIECDGKPDWLSDDEPVTVKWSHGDWSSITDGTAAKFFAHDKWLALKLPADHPHYATRVREAEFGPEIAVNGVRPEWLTGDQLLPARLKGGDWCSVPQNLPEDSPATWSVVEVIRLPATHWAYTPIAKGFKPWSGGDEAPGDWDGGEVMCRNGGTMQTFHRWHHIDGGGDIIGYKPRTEPTAPAFKAGDYVVALESDDHVSLGETRRIEDLGVFEINDGYRRYRPATPAEIEQYEAERRLERAYEGTVETRPFDETNYNCITLPMMTEDDLQPFVQRYWDGEFTTAGDLLVGFAKEIGLIRAPQSDIECFEDFHGGLDNNQRDIAEMAIKWARENG